MVLEAKALDCCAAPRDLVSHVIKLVGVLVCGGVCVCVSCVVGGGGGLVALLVCVVTQR